MEKHIKTIFCAREQKETPHELGVEMNGEITATCVSVVSSDEGNPPGQICGRVLKFPSNITPDEFDGMVNAHKESNEGHITTEALDAKLAEFADQEETK